MSKYGEVSKAEFGVYALVSLLMLASAIWFLGRPAPQSKQDASTQVGQEEGVATPSIKGSDKLPAGFPGDFPFSPSVMIISSGVGDREGEYRVQMKTTQTRDVLIAWYASQLPKNGWRLTKSEPAGEKGYRFFLGKEGKWSAELTLQGNPKGPTNDLVLTVDRVK